MQRSQLHLLDQRDLLLWRCVESCVRFRLQTRHAVPVWQLQAHPPRPPRSDHSPLRLLPSQLPPPKLPCPLPLPTPALPAGQLTDCAEGFTCTGSDPGCAPVVQPITPEEQPGVTTADDTVGFTPCTEADNSCLADKTGYCLGGVVVSCEDSTECGGEAGQAACAPSNTTAPPSPPAPDCTEADFTCINAEASYCLGQEQVDCPPGGWWAGAGLGRYWGGWRGGSDVAGFLKAPP